MGASLIKDSCRKRRRARETERSAQGDEKRVSLPPEEYSLLFSASPLKGSLDPDGSIGEFALRLRLRTQPRLRAYHPNRAGPGLETPLAGDRLFQARYGPPGHYTPHGFG